ncbi:hypothetical protein [Rhodococcus sp. UNC363MFTsu5.1]|uniref:hypothetical protein n=1 Tax=Rhodococcus sp. UNC363MFTsu5.1 TaxID=1449069 RepID=UPI00047F33EF|nr:hypothetical protein [Rhodococcus sp. UNC363MFTsu5.1]
MTTTEIRTRPPRQVELSFTLLCVALLAGIVEAILQAARALEEGAASPSAVAAQGAVRLAIYGAVYALAIAMQRGSNPARLTLLIGLGTVGIGSLVVEPAAWLLSANGFDLADLTVASTLIALARTVHVIAVVAGLGLLLGADARRYFARG